MGPKLGPVEPDLNAARRIGGRLRDTFSRSETVRRRVRLVPWLLTLFIGSAVLGIGSWFYFWFLEGSNAKMEPLLFFLTETALIVSLGSGAVVLLLWRR
jgi:hypothetical protein